MKKRSFLLLCVFSVTLLGGCKFKDLHHGLEEGDTNEILVMLHESGIEARKEVEQTAGQVSTWKVVVEAKNLERARQLLVANHLPRHKELGLSGVYKDKGLIPTPDEQQARFLLALKGEIINSLKKIPGVVDADVVLNVPTENDFAELDTVKKRPTASVVVRTRGEVDISLSVTEGKIQRFVSNSIPNMDPNDVTVIVTRMISTEVVSPPVARSGDGLPGSGLSPVSATKQEQPVTPDSWIVLGGIKMEPGSVTRFKMYMISLLFLLLAVSVGLLVNLVRINRLKGQVQGEPLALAPYEGESAGTLPEGGGGMEGTFNVGQPQAAQRPKK